MKRGPAWRGPAVRGPAWRGPAWLVTAAFLGPGTLTTATLAGQATGLGLLWALVLSLALTAGLQLLLVQLVIDRRRDLGALIRETLEPPGLRWFSVILTALAIGFGNAAYQAGNLTGAALGLGAWLPLPPTLLGPGLAALAALLLLTPLRTRLEGLLLGLIAVMAAVFCLAALASLGAGVPPLTLTAPAGQAGALALALIGTTVVPYNLFLHGRALLDRLPPAEEPGTRADAALHQDARRDTLRAVAVGGLITGAILLLAAGSSADGSSLERLAAPLRPLLGAGAEPFLALGLFAAGLSSALTAQTSASSRSASCASRARVAAAQSSSRSATVPVAIPGPETAQGPIISAKRSIVSGRAMAKPSRKPASPQNLPKLFRTTVPGRSARCTRLASGITSPKLSSITVRGRSPPSSVSDQTRPSGLFGCTTTSAPLSPTPQPFARKAAQCSL